MRINKVAFIGKGGVGLLYGSMIARVLGDDAVEFVMDDARYERHAADQLRINGEPCGLRSVRAAPDTDPAVVADIADLYSRVGIAHVVEPDIKRRMWTKLMMNVGVNQTCMVYGGTYGSATERGSEQRRSLVAAMREARVVANAEGVAIAESDLSQMVELLETLDPAGMPSMAQDRIARRKTEVEEFSGTICRLAAEHGIEVPQNEWLYQRIREIEASW